MDPSFDREEYDADSAWPIERILAALEGWAVMQQALPGKSDLARALGAMVEASRLSEWDRVPVGRTVRCRMGILELRQDAEFTVRGRNTLSAGIYNLHRLDRPRDFGAVALKIGRMQTLSESGIGILSEAMFYCFLRDACESEGLRIPTVLAVYPYTDEEGQLFIEYLPDCRPIAGLDEMSRAAWAIGRFSGHCHRRGLFETEWLRRNALSLLPRQLEEFDLLLQQVPGSAALKRAIESGFSGVLGGFLAIRERHAQGLPTVCHGDLHASNFVAMESGGFAVLDWAWINRGLIGDDLAVLAYPWLVTSSHSDPEIDFADADARLLAAYCDGAGADLAVVAETYRLKSVIACLNMAKHYRRWMLQPKDRGMRHQRALRVGRFYRFMASVARKAAGGLR